EFVTKLDHLGELVARVDMEKWKWQRTRIERLARQMHQHARVFTNGIQQHRIAELRERFAENVNRFAFKLAKVRPFFVHTATFLCRCRPHSFWLSCSHHQRPARMSSPAAIALIQRALHILGYPRPYKSL